MKTAMIVKSSLTAVAFLLISTAANAQSAPASRTSHHANSTQPRDAQSGMASGKTQRKSGAIVAADYGRNGKGNVHGAQPPSSPQQVQKGDNPLYKDHGKSGTNPMYEPSRINSGPKGPVQGQPGQSGRASGAPLKGVATSAIPRSDKAAAANGGSGPDVYQRKHIAGVKYEDRTAPGGGAPTGAHTPAHTPSHKPK